MGYFDKPTAGTTVNLSSPYCPRTATGLLFGFLDSSAGSVKDDFRGLTFTAAGTAGGPTWDTSPGFPGGSGPALDLIKSPNVSQFTNGTAPTGTGVSGYISAMCICKIRSTSIDGPHPLGNGLNGSVILEPSFTTTGNFYVLNGGVAHLNTGLSVSIGDWVFCGVSYKTNDHYDAYVYDYTTASGASVSNSAGPLSASDGTFIIGSSYSNLPNNATDGMLWWGMIDHGPWTIADMTTVAANPFIMYTGRGGSSYFFPSPSFDGGYGPDLDGGYAS